MSAFIPELQVFEIPAFYAWKCSSAVPVSETLFLMKNWRRDHVQKVNNFMF
jgi:hypothetical protein